VRPTGKPLRGRRDTTFASWCLLVVALGARWVASLRPMTDDGERGRRTAPVRCHRDRLPADRGLTPTQLADRTGLSVVNLSVVSNDRPRAVRFSTATAICDALDCQPRSRCTRRRTPPAPDRAAFPTILVPPDPPVPGIGASRLPET